jgi:hypothetical protein
MSEYQYYEFQAIDRPLGEADRQALRDLSTRARITATSFTNSYEWGSFKGDPAKLMELWFDLHLYFANWGSRRLMMRLPKRLVDRRLLDGFLAPQPWASGYRTAAPQRGQAAGWQARHQALPQDRQGACPLGSVRCR